MLRSTLTVAMVLLAASPVLAAELKSGPQVGDGVPGGFSTQFINGDQGGNRRCPV
jgi:hypothetical protein